MIDCILIEGLDVRGVIGVYDWEREGPRTLQLDVVLELPLAAAAVSDALDDTIDYDAVAATAQRIADEQVHQLIEHYAGRLISAVLAEQPVQAVTVTVRKPGAVAAAQSVGVRMRRSRDAD